MLRGDLDGDLCFITWDDKLIPKKVDPMDYCNEVTHNGPCCYTRDAVSCLLFLGFRRRENSFRLPEDRREMFELLLHRLRTKSIMEAMDALPSIFGACRLKNRPHCKSTSMSLVF
ncbi:uncharacterized protein [Zea mays]|uniref:uncharacterized protein isoform X2 n=1 Tax=Zea mays TaxID=4577 RepID=UPI0004DE9B5A|nr:uncharacterized protein LOC103643898 isoform X2 [Zea mays]|eukprot:XP_008665291.1 uncharacterized protein LOC103643898 [Zea mays]